MSADLGPDPAKLDVDLACIRDAVQQPLPEEGAEPNVLERYITRQHQAEGITAGLSGRFARNQGLALVSLQKQVGHGKWEKYVSDAYEQGRLPLSIRTVRDRIAIARGTTDEEAATSNAVDLLAKIGRANDRSTAIEDAGKTLDRAATSIRKLTLPASGLLSSLRKCLDLSAITTLTDRVGTIRTSLSHLETILKDTQGAVQQWNDQRSKGDTK